MTTMEPLAFARMLGSLEAGIPEPGEKETDIIYARAVVGQAVEAFSKIHSDEGISETAKTVRLVTKPLLEDLLKAQARVNEKIAALDKTSNVLNIVAGLLQLMVFEHDFAQI